MIMRAKLKTTHKLARRHDVEMVTRGKNSGKIIYISYKDGHYLANTQLNNFKRYLYVKEYRNYYWNIYNHMVYPLHSLELV